MELLKQEQYHPYRMHEEVIILLTALNHLFDDFDIKNIKSVKNDLLAYFNNNKKDIVNTINDKKVLDDELKVSIVENAREYLNGKH